MRLTLLVVPLHPHVTSLLLSNDLVTKLRYLFSKLPLAQLKLPLNSLFLDFGSFHESLKLNNFFVKFFQLLAPLRNGILFQFYNFLQRPVALNLVNQFGLEVMSCFVHFMKLVYRIIIFFRS